MQEGAARSDAGRRRSRGIRQAHPGAMWRFGLPLLLAAAPVVTGLTTVFEWRRLEGAEAPGFLYLYNVGWELQQGRWLIALSLAGLLWALMFFFNRDLFIALTGVGLAAAALGVTIWAVNEFGTNALESLAASSVWLAIALFVLGVQWWAEGHSRPVVVEIFHDFRFSHFLTTSFVGLLWSLGMAAATTGVFATLIEYWHQDSLVFGVLAGLVALAIAIVWLLWMRLLLEAIVVLFRIYGELRSINGWRSPSPPRS